MHDSKKAAASSVDERLEASVSGHTVRVILEGDLQSSSRLDALHIFLLRVIVLFAFTLSIY